MKMKSILSHTKRMLVMAICLCATWQVNAITIKVMKGGTAPHLYTWTGDGSSKVEYSGTWPGTQFTTKDDNGYWTMDIPNQTTVNLILNMGNGQPQTADYLDIPGVNGNITILYDGNNTMFGTMPTYSYQEGKVAYFVSPSTWDGNLYCKIKHNGYEEAHPMTKIGTDGMGLDVYADFNFINWDDTPQYIQFYDTSNHHVEYMNYTLGGYYNAFVTYPVATFYSLSSANGFTDDNFRSGIAAQAGINDGDVFTPSSITKLDVSGRGITSLAGINHFAMLIELNASDNALTTADLGSNANLEILNLSKNTGLHGFSSYYSNNSNTYINIATNNSNLKELYLTDCTIGSFQAIKNHYGVSSLERLDLSNNPNMHGWSSGIAAQTGLKYLNVSNNDYGNDELTLTTLINLDTLIVDNNPNLGNISTLGNATNLRYVSLQNCGLTNSIGFGNNTKLEYINISNNSATAKSFKLSNNPALKVFKATNAAIKENGLTWDKSSPNLDTLIVADNGNMQYLNSLHYASGLKYFDMSHGDLYLQSMPTFVGTNFPLLEYLDFSYDKITEAKTLQDFPALKTLKIGGNYLTSNSHGIDNITLSNCPAIETIDVSGSLNMAEIGLVNQGYTNSNFTLPTITYSNCHLLSMLDMSNNGFTSVPELTGIPSTIVSLKLNNNALSSLAMPTSSPIQFLYAENNAGFTGDYELTATTAGNLKGLDLGNNGFTSFKAEGTALSALMIGDNTSLATLELHGNNNLTCTTAETTMSEGSGLYLLGNTNLATINIENSKFNNIGANGSLYGLSKVKTLRASHNEFKTFTNSNYDAENDDARSHSLDSIKGKPSLEDLTGLVYLDLSHNQLKDSVHLYRNTALKHLDVSHNQVLGPLPTTDAEREAMITKKLNTCLKYGVTIHGDSTGNHKIGPVGKSVTLTNALRTELTQHDSYRHEDRYADFRPCDLRDTVGLYHLDLYYNTQLEYIDISYTNIHNTAAGREFMNPGWESSPNGWNGWVDNYSPKAQYGPVKHHFILMRGAPNLRVFKADHNNMQSLGTANNHQLDTLSATHMYGDCHFMAGHSYDDYIGYGSKGFNGDNCKIARYIDLSYGSFYSIDPTNLANVEKLIVTGNPLGGGKYPDYVLDVTHNGKLQQLQADTCGNLQTIEAHNLAYLTTLDVTNDTDLRTLRAYDDPVLYNAQTGFITGLPSCSALEELWVSNDKLPELDVEANTNLTKLKCYQNIELAELGLTHNPRLSYLDFHNCKLNEIDLSENTALTYIDCSSPRVAQHLEEDGINKLSDLDIYSNNIQTVIANNNNLYRMTGLNKPSLTSLKFAHNHINGIDLSQTSLIPDSLVDNDNGRTIAADYTIVTVKDANNNATHYDLYFFQLDSLAGSDGGVFIGNKYSQDPLKDNAYREDLNYEGMVSSQITNWTANAKLLNTNSKNSPIDLGDVENLIDPDRVIGTIVVLDQGPKHAEYTYDTGVSGHTSTYYLDWDAPSVITAVTEIENDNKPTVIGGTGVITIQAPEGTAIMVYDMAGRLVQQATAGGGEVVIDGMSPGVYIVNGEKVIVK